MTASLNRRYALILRTLSATTEEHEVIDWEDGRTYAWMSGYFLPLRPATADEADRYGAEFAYTDYLLVR